MLLSIWRKASCVFSNDFRLSGECRDVSRLNDISHPLFVILVFYKVGACS